MKNPIKEFFKFKTKMELKAYQETSKNRNKIIDFFIKTFFLLDGIFLLLSTALTIFYIVGILQARTNIIIVFFVLLMIQPFIMAYKYYSEKFSEVF